MQESGESQIGFIGQGWIGKNFADDFEMRGYKTVRYALEEPYCHNKKQLQECQLVYIAVPTPTTPEGFSCEPVIDALTLLKAGTTAIIKSTILPGTTKRLQSLFPNLYVMHSPEFLAVRTVLQDVKNPARNIIGIPVENEEYLQRAERALRTLPKAPYEKIMSSDNAELVKYAGNTFLTTKILFMNILYDFVEKNGGDWNTVREAMVKDLRIGESHTQPVFEGGRGAGGHCFIKDYEAFRRHHKETVGEQDQQDVLTALTKLNIDLLTKTGKSLDILAQTFEFNIRK